MFQFGIAGQFWQSAVTSVQLLLFAMVVIEFRTKAPGAKTFLQVNQLSLTYYARSCVQNWQISTLVY